MRRAPKELAEADVLALAREARRRGVSVAECVEQILEEQAGRRPRGTYEDAAITEFERFARTSTPVNERDRG